MKKLLLIILIIISFQISACKSENSLPEEQTVNIPSIKSTMDFNQNGIDDYTDIMLGAREDIKNNPCYDGSFYAVGGYPPDDIGVCSDTIWRAFKHAGYNLKEMVDKDIKENLSEYPRVEGKPDPNIDFRRVKNLSVYFKRHATSLTLDKTEIEEWNAGDIVIFENPDHSAIVSDKRNDEGIPFIIHNAGHPEEADRLDFSTIIGHYRFDAEKLSEAELIKFSP